MSRGGGKTAKLIEEFEQHVAGVDLGAPGGDKTVITIGYLGDRAKNRGLERAIVMLQAKYPNAEIRPVKIDPTKPKAGARPVDWFNAQLGPVK